MSILRIFVLSVLSMVGVGIVTFGALGFVPGVSTVFGSDRPRDLGVVYAQKDLADAQAKTGITFGRLPVDQPPEKSLAFSGVTVLKADLTGPELSALIAGDKWKYNFVQKPQVRIGRDGEVEVSGILRLDRIEGYLRAHGIPADGIKPLVDRLAFFGADPAFHLVFTAAWKDGKLSLDILQAEVGRLPVTSWLKPRTAAITAAVQAHVLAVPGLAIKSLAFDGGKMHFDGALPRTIDWAY